MTSIGMSISSNASPAASMPSGIPAATAASATAVAGSMKTTAAMTSVSTATVSGTSAYPTSGDGYQIKCEIGHGAFAKVYQAYCPSKNEDVAVKIIELDNIVSSLDDIYKEVRVTMLCKNPYVLGAHASFIVGSGLWLVMPLMRKGSCLRIIKYLNKTGKRSEGFEEEWIASIMKMALEGLDYFHSQGQVHRDFKAGNLLMDKDGRVVICDFGVAAWLNGIDRKENRNTFVGTPCWMAPEVMEHEHGYDEKADIWSVGITLLELAKGSAPYAHMQPLKILMKTLKDPPPSLKSYESYKKGQFSKQFSEIVAMCLQKNPKDRPSCAQLLQKSFFKKAKPPTLLVKELLEDLAVPDVDTYEDVSSTLSSIPVTEETRASSPGVPNHSKSMGTQPPSKTSTMSSATGSVGAESAQSGTEKVSKSSKGFVRGATWVFDDDDEANSAIPKKEKKKQSKQQTSSTTASSSMSVKDADDMSKMLSDLGLPAE